jgi:O-antigen/teichoic acid export membrane protein
VDRSTLKRQMATSSLWSAISSGGNQIVSFIIFVVIARLVTPAEFGLVALASLLIDLMQVLSAGGIPDALVQRRELEEDVADTAFWTNLAAGVLFGALALALAYPLQMLFDMPGLARVIALLSISFVIAPLGMVHAARLTRAFGFRTLALRNLLASLASGGIGVVVALRGGGVDALIAQRIAAVVLVMVISWLGFRWVPRRRFTREAFMGLARYGTRSMGAQFLLQLNVRLPELLAGLLLGPAAVGIVRIANRCVDMLGQLTVVPFQQSALPVLARAQGDVALSRHVFADFSRLSAFVIFPAFAGACTLAPLLVPTVFSGKWGQAGPLMQVICLNAVALQFNVLMIAMLNAAGFPGHVLKWSAAQLVLGVAMCVAGAQYGVMGLVACNVLRAYLMLPVGLATLARCTRIAPMVVWRSIANPLGASLLMALMVVGLRLALSGAMPAWAELAVSALAGALVYLALSARFSPDLLQEAAAMLPGPLRRRLHPG